MTDPAGSYRAADSNEAERLKQQAAGIWTRERSVLQRLGLMPGQRIIDMGCGPGGTLRQIVADFTPELAVGLDIDFGLLRTAREVAHVLRADGAHLPCAADSVDFVLMRLVLRHAPGREQLVQEAARVVRPGGTICAIDVDEAATALDPEPVEWPSLKAALIGSAERHGGDPFVGRRLRRLFLAAGLQDTQAVLLPVTTLDLSARAFVDVMLAPAVRPIDADLLDTASVKQAWGALRRWASRPDAFGYALGIAVAGKKPL